MTIHEEIAQVILKNFTTYKNLAEKAFDQLGEDDFYYKPDSESNSIAIIIQHMAGNMQSRFTDFLTSDGEKSTRNRDSEFEDNNLSKAQLLERWQAGWKVVFDAIQGLGPEDLQEMVLIRQEPLSVIDALMRQVTHYSYHIGQIVFLAKHIKRSGWKSLSIPKGQSDAYNRMMIEKLRSANNQ
jgi:uncharacterized damage-inducible protein DinB